ncbi:Glucosinolate gamma-glutamyl hydrolase [Ascochyta rabiei]|nr:Glucosinolate gamma-glutamyl hydrolase [Ascochyta rabiei]UPX14396.1 Glucosinolate gamma-glutamyl hydrolase [Ascochyta rabiei]
MQDFLRTMGGKCPTQKIVGICWGHETIHLAFGGLIGPMDGFEVGVTPIALTSPGSTFCSSYLPSIEAYSIHEFHELEVKTPGKGFTALAENNLCLVNAANIILTFQGHLEVSVKLPMLLLSYTPRYTGASVAEKEALDMKIASPYDGIAIWKKIVHWAGEV